MMSEEQNKALDSWQIRDRYWDKYRVLIAQMFAPLTSGLVEEARIAIGQNVLDIGGGSGEPSLTISGIVGPSGSVMYLSLIHISEPTRLLSISYAVFCLK